MGQGRVCEKSPSFFPLYDVYDDDRRVEGRKDDGDSFRDQRQR